MRWPPHFVLGMHQEIAEHLLACRRWGMSYHSVRKLEPFAAVIERLQHAERTASA